MIRCMERFDIGTFALLANVVEFNSVHLPAGSGRVPEMRSLVLIPTEPAGYPLSL